ncbi:MAG: hypothetical protein EXR12_05465 [Rhodospirillaceae bacterium]|nr:hypothetical protein [Rhodospirillaceae bacterium]
MRIVSWLAAAGLVMGTAGCVETTDYPTTYGYSPGGYNQGGYNQGYRYQGYSNNYYSQPSTYRSQPSYYAPQVVTQTRYVAVPVAQPRSSSRGLRDNDGDGIPNRYDRDKNGDGVPDRYRRRQY